MTKKIISAIMALTIMAGLTIPASAANDNTTNSSKRYYIDLEMATDKEFEECGVDLEFFINGQRTMLYSDGRTVKPDGTVIDESDLGSAVLFDYRPNGKLDQDSMPVTYIGIRRVANALGLAIDWNDTTKNVVLDTPKGRIEFPIGATSITAPDGTKYEEQTYRFPNGDPINVVSMRANRTYTTVRFVSTFLMPDATFKWKGTERLTITGTIEGTTVEKTYGINKNYMNVDNHINWPTLPNFNAAVEAAGKSYSATDAYGVINPGVSFDTSVDGVTMGLGFGTSEDNAGKYIFVGGYDPIDAQDLQLSLIKGFLKDMVCDNDAQAILGKYKEISTTMSKGWNPNDGATEAALTWRSNYQKTYSLSEVKIVFNEYLTELRIYDK